MINRAQTVSIEVNEETVKKIKDLYSEIMEENSSEYIEFFAKRKGLSVSVYKPNKKGIISVVFQGPEALSEARIFDQEAKPAENKPKVKKPIVLSKFPQIGSDEVGTGDAFGPVVVCSAYVEEKDLPFLRELGVTDSKLLDDHKIREIGKILIKKFDYSLLVLMPEKFNEVKEENNLNRIKARMHNQAIGNLLKKHKNAHIYLDQFAQESTYYSYLTEEKNVVHGIVFATKGETKYISVALGSVIARYAFLLKMDELSKKLGMPIPLGAGADVDKFIAELLKSKSKDELKKFAKLSWANFKKLG